MTSLELAPEVLDDFERILDHLVTHGAADAAGRIQGIVGALDVLQENPRIGRPVGQGQRELVIGRASRGYLARYRYINDIDMVFVLAVRAQREADCWR